LQKKSLEKFTTEKVLRQTFFARNCHDNPYGSLSILGMKRKKNGDFSKNKKRRALGQMVIVKVAIF
jgi:hypothetical protein